jgi:hypothetical protein
MVWFICHLARKVFVCVFRSSRLCHIFCNLQVEFVVCFLLYLIVSVSSWSSFVVSGGKSWSFVVLRQLGGWALAGKTEEKKKNCELLLYYTVVRSRGVVGLSVVSS